MSNGETKKAVHIVDKEKAKAVTKKVNKKFQSKQDDWGFIPSFYRDGFRLIGNVLYIPVVLVVAVLEAVRAGFIAGLSKALAMYR